MRVKIVCRNRDYCSQGQQLEGELNRLLADYGNGNIIVPIEIKDSPSFWSKFRKFLETRSIKPSDGEVVIFPRRKVILYKRAFQGNFQRLMHVALHEIGHFLDLDYQSQAEREKRADEFAERFGYGHSSLGE